LVNVGFILAMQ